MIEQLAVYTDAIIGIIVGIAGVCYGLYQRISNNEYREILEEVKAAVAPTSESGNNITITEAMTILDKVIMAVEK